MDEWRNLSVAEIKTLQEPEREQVATVLPLLLKELVLKKWLEVRKSTRPISTTIRLLEIIWCALGLWFNIFIGLLLVVLVLYLNQYIRKKEHTLIFVTPDGQRQLRQSTAQSLQHSFLHDVHAAIEAQKGYCSWKDLRYFLQKKYSDNQNYHDKVLMNGLLSRQLVFWDEPARQFKRTGDGETLLTEINRRLQEAMPLASMVRSKSPDALLLFTTLGALVLLLPNMQGYFSDLLQMLPPDIYAARRTEDQGGSGGDASSYEEEKTEPSKDTDSSGDLLDDTSDGFMDGGLNFDLLDGSMDGDLGGDLGSDSGGCGGDSGGDGGCGGGCGGD